MKEKLIEPNADWQDLSDLPLKTMIDQEKHGFKVYYKVC